MIFSRAGVYTITNKANDHRYVGSSNDVNRRRGEHLDALQHNDHDNPYLQYAFNKYGADVFEFEVLFFCPPRDCTRWEQQMMDTLLPEYNICPTARFRPETSSETRAKLRLANRGRGFRSGQKHTVEARAKMSLAKQGNTNALGHSVSSQTRGRLRALNLGRRHSDETRAKRSRSITVWWAARKASS